jgi:predicted transcriptional regulator
MAKKPTLRERLMLIMVSSPVELTAMEIAELLNSNYVSVSAVLLTLVKQKKITRTEKGGKFYYS